MSTRNERLKNELALIEKNHFLTINQIATCLEVSEMTVRRDLHDLKEEGSVRLVYGGVTPIRTDSDQNSYTLESEQDRNIALKKSIVMRAIQLIDPHDVIFLDSGTTVQLLAEQIPAEYSCTLIASSLNTLDIITKLPNSTVITPGGVFSPKPVVFYDPESTKLIRKYRANKAFIGATGYELKLGLTCGYIEDAPLKQAMIESSKDRILLIDSTKFGKVSACLFAKIEEFTIVITDSGIPREYAEQIKANNVQLIIA